MASTRAPGEYVATATCGYAVSETLYLKFEVRKMISIMTQSVITHIAESK